MTPIEHLDKHLNGIFFGGNWTASNVKDTISSITLKDAKQKIGNCNTIAHLVFHINYYVEGVLPVFDGGQLSIKDKFSYDVPNFEDEAAWEAFKTRVLSNAKQLSDKIKGLKEDTIFATFADEKYGTYYTNIHGIIEHTHYHLGQIALLKKLISK